MNRRLILRIILAFLSMAAVLFLTAGTWKWIEGWILILLYLSWAIFIGYYLRKNNPGLLEKRLSMKWPSLSWDKMFIFFLYLCFLIQFFLLGFDAVRFKWSMVPLWVEILGFAGLLITFYIYFLVMKENPFLARNVEIVPGQKVITTGAYKYVRHPMYLGGIIMMISMSLALGSFYSLIPGILNAVNIIIRTQLEDTTLQNELAGYKAYMKKTPYKLLPGIW